MAKSELNVLIDMLKKDRKERGNSREKSLEILYRSGIVTKTGELREEYQTHISKKDIKQMTCVLDKIKKQINHFKSYYGIIPHTLYIGELEYNILYYCNSIIEKHDKTVKIDSETHEYTKIKGLNIIRVKKDKYCKVGI
ncbi:MAG: hypothetical protein PHU71_05725 [Candidatus Gracilibacteria bacterium]|nr:hypothetical protein [Candidatus Gracilibacteria bacterium]